MLIWPLKKRRQTRFTTCILLFTIGPLQYVLLWSQAHSLRGHYYSYSMILKMIIWASHLVPGFCDELCQHFRKIRPEMRSSSGTCPQQQQQIGVKIVLIQTKLTSIIKCKQRLLTYVIFFSLFLWP